MFQVSFGSSNLGLLSTLLELYLEVFLQNFLETLPVSIREVKAEPEPGAGRPSYCGYHSLYILFCTWLHKWN